MIDGAFFRHSSLFYHFYGAYSSLFYQKQGCYSSLFYQKVVRDFGFSRKISQNFTSWQQAHCWSSLLKIYVIVKNMKVMPIECKAGTSGKMKSLCLFMRKQAFE